MVASLQQQGCINNNNAVIPALDLGPYLCGVPEALESTAVALRAALEGIGFFLIVNHGVPQGLIDQTFAQAKAFS
jgi:isopenicillin N synthase-like dioxygenase